MHRLRVCNASCPPSQKWCSTNGSTQNRCKSGCPRPVRVLALTVEPHVGGNVHFDIDDKGTRVLITGRFLVIDRPRTLRFTWSASDFPDPTTVSVVNVAFEPLDGDQTLMSIEHSLLPPEEFDDYQNGWTLTSDQLAALLQGG